MRTTIFTVIVVYVLLIFLFLAGCYIAGQQIGLFYKEDLSARYRLAKLNRLGFFDVSVQTSRLKSDFCEITFHKIPPDGIFRVGSSLSKSKHGWDISCTIPGGDISELLNHEEVDHIRKVGNDPIRCGKPPSPQLIRNNWSFEGFSMDDLAALSGIRSGADKYQIELKPADGLIDWQIIAKFPAINWRFTNVSHYRNAKNTTVHCEELAISPHGRLELPEKFVCQSFRAYTAFPIEWTHFDAEALRSLDINASSATIEALQRFNNLENLALSWAKTPISCKKLLNFTKLQTLEFIDCELTDVAGLADMPKLSRVQLQNCTISATDRQILDRISRSHSGCHWFDLK